MNILWLSVLLLPVLLVLLRRPLGRLLRLGARSCVALGLLSAAAPFGLGLGANWVNALILGALGAPGFGLLLMVQWALSTH